ncbi:MAG: DMT family transporter [Thermoplasmata archaeon]
MTTPAKDRTNLVLLGLLGLIWGAAYPVIQYGIVEGATPITFAAVRYGFSALGVALLAGVIRVPRPAVRALGLSALVGIPIIGMYGLFLYIGEQTTSGGLASILIGITPLLTVLFALPVLPGESLRRSGYLGLAVGLIGVIVLVFPPPGVRLASSVWGPLEVLAAAASFAAGSVLLRLRRPEGENLWGVSVQLAVATVFLFLTVPFLEPHPALPLTRGVLLALAYLVVLSSVAGYALYFALHHRVGPGRANLVAYVNPVAALTVGTLLFAEPFQWWEVAGFALVVVGLTLVTGVGRGGSTPPPRHGGGESPPTSPDSS